MSAPEMASTQGTETTVGRSAGPAATSTEIGRSDQRPEAVTQNPVDATASPVVPAPVRREDSRYATDLAELLRRAQSLNASGRRVLMGITGAPGVGKSTFAQTLVQSLGGEARVVSMDGFHLAQSQLQVLGRLDRKGAIDTFDAAGFLALVRRLRLANDDVVYAPEFRRELEEAIAGAVPVEPHIPLVVVEGNYLLARASPWCELRALFDEVWYCDRNEQARIEDLVERHRAHGKSEKEARAWALGPDQRNAELIAGTRALADAVVDLDALSFPSADALQNLPNARPTTDTSDNGRT